MIKKNFYNENNVLNNENKSNKNFNNIISVYVKVKK